MSDRSKLWKPKLVGISRRKLLRALAASPFVAAAPHIAKASFMNFSGALPPVYQSGRTSLVIIGDSITWGHGLNPSQQWTYLMQQQINSRLGFTPISWGSAIANFDICARNVQIDDTTTSPFNGGPLPGPPPSSTLYNFTGAGVNGGPFNVATGNSVGGQVNTEYSATYTSPALQLNGSSQEVDFHVSFPDSGMSAYAVINTQNSGSYNIYGDWYDSGTTPLNSSPISSPGNAIFNFTGPTSVTLPTVWRMHIAGVTGFPYITTLQITPEYPTTHVIVQICARNSYAIADFSTPYPDYTIQQAIMNTVIATRGLAANSPPIYIIALGAVTLYDSGNPSGTNSRQINPTNYYYQLAAIYNALVDSSYTNYGRVILTVPLLPEAGTGWTLLSPYTVDDYRQAVISLARTEGIGYIDLTQVNLVSGDYQSDGLHPSASGAQKIANHYISALGL